MQILKQGRISARGFSLIELLIVIGILAILGSVLAPVLAQARGQLRGYVCLANVRQLSSVATMYAQDYDELFAAPSLMPNGWLPDLHAPYLRQWKVFVCPSDPKAQVWDGVWASQTFFRRTSYIWNAYIFQGDPADYRRSLPMAAIPSPATVVLWLDGYANAGWVTDAVPPSVPDRGYAYIHTAYGDSLNASKRDPSAAPCRVHNGEHLNTKHAEGGNYAFVDGHAKWFMPGAFTTEALLRSRGAIMNDRTDPFVTNGARQAAISTICPVFCCPRDIGTPPGDGNHPWFRP